MCYSICVYSDKLNDKIARSVADPFRMEATLRVEVWPAKKWLKKTPLHLSITEEGGCACSLLSESADWNLETYDLRPEILPLLINTFKKLSEILQDEMTIESLWAGDKIENEVEVPLNDFLEVVRNNRVGGKTRYKIMNKDTKT